jgi:hypothetical protein
MLLGSFFSLPSGIGVKEDMKIFYHHDLASLVVRFPLEGKGENLHSSHYMN